MDFALKRTCEIVKHNKQTQQSPLSLWFGQWSRRKVTDESEFLPAVWPNEKVRIYKMDVLMSNTSLSDVARLCLTGLKIALIVQVPECALCVGVQGAHGVFPYLIIIWFVVTTSLRLAVDSLLGFISAVVDGFHLGAKFRVFSVEVLVPS